MDEVVLREATAADSWELSVIGAATFVDAFAALIPGEALLTHCRNKHVPAKHTKHCSPSRKRVPGWPRLRRLAGLSATPWSRRPSSRKGSRRLAIWNSGVFTLLSRFHGSGAGRQMMEAAIAHARGQGAPGLLLGVHPENHRALAFYRRHGFRVVGGRRFQVGSAVFEDPVLRLAL